MDFRDNTHVIPGFFNESLTPGLAVARGMRPALYVDIDVDLYSQAPQPTTKERD